MLEAPLESGAHLFFWIVCIFIAFIAAVSFIDFSKTHGPSDPYPSAEDDGNDSYWKSRKHAEDVHREFPKGKAQYPKDPVKATKSEEKVEDKKG